MRETAPTFAKSAFCLPGCDLTDYTRGRLLDGEIRQHSERTRGLRQDILDKFLWFLRQNTK